MGSQVSPISYYAHVGDRRVTLTLEGSHYWVKLWAAAQLVEEEYEGKRYTRLIERGMPLDSDYYGTLSLACEGALDKYRIPFDGWYREGHGERAKGERIAG